MKFMKLGAKPDSFQTDGNDIVKLNFAPERLSWLRNVIIGIADSSSKACFWSVATELNTDIIINVGGIKFYLHKFPLLSKSSRLQKLVAATNGEDNDEIQISDIPGGPAAFEICAKFCYSMTVTLNAYNVVAARCAAEYLEMNETMEKGNLIYKIEVFLNSSIFRSWKDSIIVLKTTKSLLPWSEDLKIINHCIDSIASKACIDTSRVEWSYTYNRKKLPSENGHDSNWNGVRKPQKVPKDWWVEDLCELDIDFYKQVIVAIRSKGRMPSVVFGEAVKAYTYRRLPGFRRSEIIQGGDVMKNILLVETVISLSPMEKGSVSCIFLLKLLSFVSVLGCSEVSKKELVRRIGCQLEEASVADLLIPNTPGDNTTMYDIDLVLNIVEEFVMQEPGSARTGSMAPIEDQDIRSPVSVLRTPVVAVAKLIDGYLAEIAKDSNLPLLKFVELAEMLSGASRPVHDDLYHAIDMYLKEHPGLSKSEKRKICNLMDCKKLSADACMHAVQNERLPLRVVVQVLFFEQARAAAACRGPELLASLGSYGSSRSAATTTTEGDCDDLKSVKSMRLEEVKGVAAVAMSTTRTLMTRATTK